MKAIITWACCIGMVSAAYSQINLPYSEDFNGGSGLPSGWQSTGPSWAPDWVVSSNMAYIRQLSGNVADVALLSPSFNTASVPNPVVEYKMQINPSNLNCTPELSIMYSTDGGQTRNLITNIGTSDACSSSDFIVNSNQWYWLYTALPSASDLIVVFDGDFPTNGYGTVFLDDVVVRDLNWVGVGTAMMEELDVYPNPTTEGVRINAGHLQLATFSITDVTGKVAAQGVIPEDRYLPLTSVSPGCYLLSVEDTEGRRITKFIVKR